LNSAGYPDATSATTAYAGVAIGGARALTLTDPEPQQIVHYGDDRVFALDVLPATEPISGSLSVGKVNDAVDAILTGQNNFAVGEGKFFGMGTSEKGNEQQVGIIAYRQVLDTTPGASQLRRWESYIIPATYLIPLAGNWDQNPEERAYTIRPQVSSKHLWGAAFSDTTEGYTEAQVVRGITEYKPKMLAWKGNNTATSFTLSPTVAADNTSKVTVYVDGVDASAGITVSTAAVVFTTAPTTDAIVVVLYETA
jgi:hypothetical protein